MSERIPGDAICTSCGNFFAYHRDGKCRPPVAQRISGDVTALPPVSELRAWADNPASSGFVPVHPSTLRAIADELTRYRDPAMVLVPREPTEAMLIAHADCLTDELKPEDKVIARYRAMIAAGEGK